MNISAYYYTFKVLTNQYPHLQTATFMWPEKIGRTNFSLTIYTMSWNFVLLITASLVPRLLMYPPLYRKCFAEKMRLQKSWSTRCMVV